MSTYLYCRGLNKMATTAVFTLMLFALVVGFSIAPAGAEVAKAAWCSQSASWAGQRGWDRWYNPNYMVDFRIHSGRVRYYIYFKGSYVGSNVISPRNYVPSANTTQFGLSTTWALRNSGWSNTSNWRIDYSC